jgi:4-hydroxy-L-threonine phosphate dehydrogenase PdxA
MKKPVIGLMLGDATGIGPEISAKLLTSGVTSNLANVVVIGDKRVLDLGIRNAGVQLGYRTVPSVDAIRWPSEQLPLLDLGNVDPARFPQGTSSAECGKLTGDTL